MLFLFLTLLDDENDKLWRNEDGKTIKLVQGIRSGSVTLDT